MKKLLAVLVILITFGLSASSYGVSLIYRVSISVKGVDFNSSLPKSYPLKGFLLLNYSDDGETLTFEDANFVIYGRNAVRSKAYIELNNYSGDGLFYIWSHGTDYKFINLVSNDSFDFEGLMFGKQKSIDIGGYPTTIILDTCVSKYKGDFWVYSGMLLDPEFDIAGTGTISATLWTSFTRKVNDDPWYTQDRILAEIKAKYLLAYTNVTPAR